VVDFVDLFDRKADQAKENVDLDRVMDEAKKVFNAS